MWVQLPHPTTLTKGEIMKNWFRFDYSFDDISSSYGLINLNAVREIRVFDGHTARKSMIDFFTGAKEDNITLAYEIGEYDKFLKTEKELRDMGLPMMRPFVPLYKREPGDK